MWVLMVLGWGSLILTAPALAAVDFAPARQDFVCGRLARDVAAIDFNSDGDVDLACVRFTIPGVVTLLAGDGHGSFRFFGELPAGDGATSILSADLDENSIPDLVTGGFLDGVNGSIGIHLGDGLGNFTYHTVSFAPGIGPFHVNAGDLDGDHHLDLVAGGSGDGVVRIFKGDGHGDFVPTLTLPGGTATQHTAVGDVDGDQDLDLAVADNMGDVLIYRGDGAGAFAPADTLDVGLEPVWIDVRTLEDRTRPYLAVALRSEHTVEVYQWSRVADAPQRFATLEAPLSPIGVTFLTPTFFHDPDRPAGGGVRKGDGPDTDRRRPGLAVISQTSSQLRIWRTTDHEPLVLPTQDSPTAIRVADWNEDGLPDFAIPGFNTESVSLFVGGKALAESAPFAPVDSLPIQFLPVAWNADPHPDFVVLRRNARALTKLVGGPDWTFEATNLGAPFPDVPTGCATFDLEDDRAGTSQPDFAVGSALHSELWILKSGQGYALETLFMAGSAATAVRAADLDRDGHDDLAASLFLTGNVSVHFARGGGAGFELPVPVAAGPGAFALDIADLNADGLLDLVVANHDGLSFSALLQSAPRVFPGAPSIPVVVGFPRGIAIGHLTDDLLPDVAVGGELGLEVFRGDGSGGFTSALFLPTAAEFERIQIADLDGDGHSELIAADRLGAAVVVLAGTAPTSSGPAAEPPGDDVLLTRPQLSFGTEFGPSDFALTELNGDGAPDIAVLSPLTGRLTRLTSVSSATPLIAAARAALGSAAAGVTAARAVAIQLAPNPFTDETSFRIAGPRGQPFLLRIFDAQGRAIATPFAGPLGSDAIDVRWNGRDDRGRAVPRGVYFYRLESAAGVPAAAGKLARF